MKCHLTMSYQVTNELDLEVQGEISPALIEQGTVESPTVVMSVTARWAAIISSDINVDQGWKGTIQ